jgi:sterol desaturase/sphingolipid hydroxylase (fatty acid hydroxylase superfamily)
MLFLEFFAAWLYGHVLEYCLHRYVLHNRKILNGVAFKFHFAQHHKVARQNDMVDERYYTGSKFSVYDHEVKALLFMALIHLPVAFISITAYATLLFSLVSYFAVHSMNHVNNDMVRRWLPWHTWHHMEKNQNMNFGVRLPIIDILMGTYVPRGSKN